MKHKSAPTEKPVPTRKTTSARMAAPIVVAATLALALGACGSAGTAQPAAGSGGSGQAQEQAQSGSGSQATGASTAGAAASTDLADGLYTVDVATDSDMFHVNEAKDGKGELTVKDGSMTVHLTLASEGIVNLFVGTAADAQKEGAQLLSPTVDTVTYPDGSTEEAFGYDVPVPALDQEFDVAILGKKGKWYDHKVSVSDPVPEG